MSVVVSWLGVVWTVNTVPLCVLLQWLGPVLWCSMGPWKPPQDSSPSPASLKVKLLICTVILLVILNPNSDLCLCVRRVDGADPSRDHGVSAHRPEGADGLQHSLRQEWRRGGPRERHRPLGGLEFTCQHGVRTTEHTALYTLLCNMFTIALLSCYTLSDPAGHTRSKSLCCNSF